MLANGLKVFYEKRHNNAKEPTYAYPTDCCCDFYAVEDVIIKRFERKLINTGIGIEMPEGFELQIRPRSGNAWKHGITVLNSPGTIDQNYRGDIMVMLINLGDSDYIIKAGDRIAQGKFSPVYKGYFIKKESLSKTDRGKNGTGSTGN